MRHVRREGVVTKREARPLWHGGSVMAVVGEFEPAGVPRHLGMARVDRAAALGKRQNCVVNHIRLAE
jgi:hypothetical protein